MITAVLLLSVICSSESAFAHAALYCRNSDSSVFSWLSFDGNGKPLVSGYLRVGENKFPPTIDPNNFPMRHESVPMTVMFGEYTLSLAIDDKTALITKPKEPEVLINCCDPRLSPQCVGEEQ